jgi:3-hydroxybutyryl-CoA dehydratase
LPVCSFNINTSSKGVDQMAENKSLATRRGLYFEEFEVGASVVSAGRTITEADVVGFAALSGDWNLIHTNAEYAKQGLFGQRVAHGLLVLSIASGLVVRLGVMEDTVLAFREMAEWKFSQPVFLGDTIRVQATVVDAKPMRRLNGGLVTLKVEILNQEDKVVQRGTWGALFKSREA